MNQDRIEQLYFVTESENKFNDYQFLMGKYATLRWVKLQVEEPMTSDLSILIRRQVEWIRPKLPHLPFLVEQTNLTIKAWNDLPGNVTRQFIDGVGVDGICKMLQAFGDQSAMVVTDLAYHAPNGQVEVFRGVLQGVIAPEPRGPQIYGWDAIFIPVGQERTFAEMSLEQRNGISTRKIAVAGFYTAVLQEPQADLLLQNRIRLRQLMTRYFTNSELDTLIFDLGLDRDEIGGSNKTEYAQEIILYCERRNQVDKLLAQCKIHRPQAEWPDQL
jgi:non-canonical purine NTP pyrophosphatase (RdgB/HAM1 family)